MDDSPIPAATVLLVRDAPAFQVLMIARHENAAFAGGALVFPGGRIEASDRDPAWPDHATGLSPDPILGAAQIAAIREAYEETGVLLARAGGEVLSGARSRALSPMRRRVAREDGLFLDLVRKEQLTLACDALTRFAHWVAPPRLHRRFDTLFFIAPAPVGQPVLEDGNEATEALWIAPAEALAARARGARKIIFPTASNLGLLGLASSVDDAFDQAARRPIRPVTPVFSMRGGEAVLTIPGDLGYPATEELLSLSEEF